MKLKLIRIFKLIKYALFVSPKEQMRVAYDVKFALSQPKVAISRRDATGAIWFFPLCRFKVKSDAICFGRIRIPKIPYHSIERMIARNESKQI